MASIFRRTSFLMNTKTSKVFKFTKSSEASKDLSQKPSEKECVDLIKSSPLHEKLQFLLKEQPPSSDENNTSSPIVAKKDITGYLSKVPHVLWIGKLVSVTMWVQSDPNNLLAMMKFVEMMELKYFFWMMSKNNEKEKTWGTKLLIDLAEDKELAPAFGHKAFEFFLDSSLSYIGLPSALRLPVQFVVDKSVGKFKEL